MRRVAVACLVGSTIEFYDFLIYGTAATLVFPTVFFRLGRKQTLIATLLIMGLSTVGVGLIPSAAAIGVAARLILIVLRLLQGFAVGGEWTGSALLTAEYAPAARRGFCGMFTLPGSGAAAVLTGLTFPGVNYTIGENSPGFMQWGWRLQFLLRAAPVGIALYVWRKVNEMPVFAEEKARKLISKAPLADLLRLRRRRVALAAGSLLGYSSFPYMASTYLSAYACIHLTYSRTVVLFVGVLSGLAGSVFVALTAILCDRAERRNVMLVGPRGACRGRVR